MAFGRKKKDKREIADLEVVNDYKEPFTWSGFWEDKIVSRYHKMRQFLDERGILGFLTSPFQYRNRLILKLFLIGFGVLLGVVPRLAKLLDETKARNAASEMTAIMDKQFKAGNIVVRPLASSQEDRQHVLVFDIEGDTSKGVPSTTSAYNVKLKTSRGVSDGENVKYRYEIVPMDKDTRLLVVYVDNRKQNDFTGIYNLFVSAKGDKEMDTPMEIVLSDTQNTTDLFESGEIDLTVLSQKLSRDANNKLKPIKEAKKKLDDLLNAYEVNQERLEASGYEISVTTDALKEYVQMFTLYPGLTDASKTKDLENNIRDNQSEIADFIISQNKSLAEETGEEYDESKEQDLSLPPIESKITVDGKTYTDAETTVDLGIDTPQAIELPDLTASVADIINALSQLNLAKKNKYDELQLMSQTLNKEVKISEMKNAGNVVED